MLKQKSLVLFLFSCVYHVLLNNVCKTRTDEFRLLTTNAIQMYKEEGIINQTIYLFVVIEYSLYFFIKKQIKGTKFARDHYQIKFNHWIET